MNYKIQTKRIAPCSKKEILFIFNHRTFLLGNAGFKTCMTRARFEKLLQYLHINHNDAQAPAGSPNFDRYKIFHIKRSQTL